MSIVGAQLHALEELGQGEAPAWPGDTLGPGALEELGADTLAELGDTMHAPRAGEGPHVCAPITWARACTGTRDGPGGMHRGPVAGT